MIRFLILLKITVISSLDVESVIQIGDLSSLKYEVAGHVFAVNQTNLLIKNFNYSGAAKDYPVLGKAVNKDIVLTLPPHLKVSDLKWLSVWCKAYRINFGDVKFVENSLNAMKTNLALNMSDNTSTYEQETTIANEEETTIVNEFEDDISADDASIVTTIISSVQNAIGTVQGYLDFLPF